MFKNNSIVVEVSIILGLIGTFLLGSVFILSKKYHKGIGEDSVALKRTLNYIETNLSKKDSCINTISKVKISYFPQKVKRIQSGNNYTELEVGTKISNVIFFKKMTIQKVYKEGKRLTLIMKLLFNDIENNKILKYFRLFHVEYGKGKKMINCVPGQRIIM